MALLGLIPLLAIASTPVQSTSDKNNEIDLTYTFSKVSLQRPLYENRINESLNNETVLNAINPTFGWGNQASFIYKRALDNSNYSFYSAFTYLHAGYTYHKQLSLGSDLNINDYTATFQPGYYHFRQQINYYQADLFMKAELSKAKHAHFSVYGGLITSWYMVKYHTQVAGDRTRDEEPRHVDENTLSLYKNYFLGPNLKVELVSPFYKDHFFVGLKAGLGLMMNFRTSKNPSLTRTYNYNTTDVSYFKFNDDLKNDYMFCPQVDLEASIGFKAGHFKLEAGLNQFLFITNLLQNRFGSLTFGGPYIKAGLEF